MSGSDASLRRKPIDIFDKLFWKSDRMLLDNLVFRLETSRNDNWDLGDECFVFYKDRGLVESYRTLLSQRSDFRPQNVFELGIWDGGSIAFWVECFQPKKHVAIDNASRGDSSYFRRYLTSRDLDNRVRTYWNTDQADMRRLRAIAGQDFDAPLDLVIDDASHMYVETKASFEALFPLLRPGGLYIIEDWAWAHRKEFQGDHPWASMIELTKFIFEAVEAVGTDADTALVRGVTITPDFAVIERGSISADHLNDFALERYILRRSARPRFHDIIKKVVHRVTA